MNLRCNRLFLLVVVLLQMGGCATYESSPLIVSIRSEDAAHVQSLIDSGADVNALSYDFIDKQGWKLTPLIRASLTANVEIVKMLLEAGADVNGKDEWGDTALMAAVTSGSAEITKLLIDTGADVNATKPDLTTALMIAARIGDLEIVEILLGSKADANIGMGSGNTALSLAAWSNHIPVMESLIKNDANLDVKFPDGTTLLCKSIEYAAYPVTKKIIDSGADVNLRCKGGTPLMAAAYQGDTNLVNELLDQGADVNMRYKSTDRQVVNSTALHFAAIKGHADVIKILLKAGIDPEVENGNGETALQLARMNQHTQTVNILSGTRVDSSVQSSPPDEKMKTYVRVPESKEYSNQDIGIYFRYPSDWNIFDDQQRIGESNELLFKLKEELPFGSLFAVFITPLERIPSIYVHEMEEPEQPVILLQFMSFPLKDLNYPNISISVQELEAYALNQGFETIKNDYTATVIDEPRKIDINDKKWITYSAAWKTENYFLRNYSYMSVKGRLYNFIALSKFDKIQEHGGFFDEIIRSVKFVDSIKDIELTTHSPIETSYQNEVQVSNLESLAIEGDGESAFRLAESYEKGVGVERDVITAAHWYLLAAELGHQQAQLKLAEKYEFGSGVQRYKLAAYKWYLICTTGGRNSIQQECEKWKKKLRISDTEKNRLQQIEEKAEKKNTIYIRIERTDSIYEYGAVKYKVSPGEILEVLNIKVCRGGKGLCWRVQHVKTGEIGFVSVDEMKSNHHVYSEQLE